MRLSLLNKPRPDAERIYESRRKKREDEVEYEPEVGFQAQYAGTDTEKRGRQVV